MWTSIQQLIARVRACFEPRGPEADFHQELESHLAMLEEDHIRRGMLRQDARRAALLELGGLAQLREAHRAARGLPFLDGLLQDARYALRTLAKSPGFAAIAVSALAIGIGVNAAAFTVYNATELRPMQASDPDHLVQITRKGRTQERFFSYPDYAYYRDNNRSFSGLAAATTGEGFSLGTVRKANDATQSGLAEAAGMRFPQIIGVRPEEALTNGVTGNYFQVLGVGASMGRTILPEDDTAAAPPVAIAGYDFWERHFARDPHLLGRNLSLNGHSVLVVGIAPPDFSGTLNRPPDLWVPMVLQTRLASGKSPIEDRDRAFCQVYGRLQNGTSPGRAAAEVNALAARLQLASRRPDDPSRRPRQYTLVPASPNGPPGANAVAGTVATLAPFGLVLLIACANVASLLLARSSARQREIAIRLAIGAGRRRLVRQLLTENAVVGLLAAAVGIGLSSWLVHFLMAQIASAMPNPGVVPIHAAPDRWVLAYSLLLALASSLGCGLAPALQATKRNLTFALKDEAAGGSPRRSLLRDLLVGAQVAVCLLLLIAAGMFTRVSQKVLAFDLGFDYRNIVYLRANFPAATSDAGVAALRIQLAREMAALPEIQSVAAARGLPLLNGFALSAVNAEGRTMDNPGTSMSLVNLVSPDYFATMGIPILRGRNFTRQESRVGFNFDGSPVLVSETAARKFWPGRDPIGKTVSLSAVRNARGFQRRETDPHSILSPVIGVVKDVRSLDLHSEGDTCLVYLPESAAALNTIVMRARRDGSGAVEAIRRELQATHRDLEAELGDSRTAFTYQGEFSAARAAGIASAILGFLGLFMASVGIYGTVAFAVTRRTQEIGIRMALGARRRSVLGLVLWETIRPVTIGLGAGFAAAAVLTHLVPSFLFGLGAFDPPAFLGVTAFLAATALVAGYLPARWATHVDPMIALRYE